MTTWDELREALSRLLTDQPGALMGFPGLDQDEAEPPYLIQLQPWASSLIPDGKHPYDQERVHRRTPVLPLTITA